MHLIWNEYEKMKFQLTLILEILLVHDRGIQEMGDVQKIWKIPIGKKRSILEIWQKRDFDVQ